MDRPIPSFPRRWGFRGSSVTRSKDERERFLGRVSEALRAAAAWPVDARIQWTAGSSAGIRVDAADPATARWFAGYLVPAYPPGAWLPEPGKSPAPPPAVAVGRALGGPERPFRLAGPLVPPWVDSVAAALFLLPGDAAVEWRIRSLGPSGSLRTAEPGLVPQPPGFRSGPAPAAVRRLADELAERSIAPLWDVRVRLLASDRAAGRPLARLVEATSREDGGNGITWRWSGRWLGRSPPRIALSGAEVLGLWPSPTLRSPGRSFVGSATRDSLLLGRSVTGAPFGLPVEPRQGRHALFLGETGMGKSSALLRAAVRASELGGVVFFDPVGDTSRRLLDRLPARAFDRVLWVSPALSPVGLNALAPASRPGAAGDRALGDLVAALRRVRAGRYSDSPFWGPRVDEMVTLALRAAAAFPDGTLRDADAILASVGGRMTGVPAIAEQRVRELADRVRARPDEVDGARRVLGEVVRSPVLARILAARNARFSLGEAIREGRIVLVTGDAPEVGESTARVLLSVLLALLWGELLAGRRQGKTFVIADELQFYANDSVAELLRLGRRFNVHLLAATQSLASLPDSIREALVTNVADVVAFRGSPDDARELSRWVADVPSESILSLRRGEAVALVGKGDEVGWVRLPFDPDRPRPDRWRTAWEQSRESWAPAEEGSGDPSETPREPADEPLGSDPVREVLLVLWAAVLSSGPGSEVSVRLDDLREELGTEEATIRSTGQRLANAGALTAADDAGSRKWTVRRDALASLLGSGVSPAELARADARWARLRERSVSPDSRKQL